MHTIQIHTMHHANHVRLPDELEATTVTYTTSDACSFLVTLTPGA